VKPSVAGSNHIDLTIPMKTPETDYFPEIEKEEDLLMDSNVDKTTRFIEGWISYWETIFYLVADAPL
jgi:hypothetical protein